MRSLIGVMLVAALAWSGYWFWGSRAALDDVESWFKDRSAEGWQAEGAAHLRGFPNRFDVTIDDPVLVDPASGIGWSAPFFQMLRLSYDPDHVIAVWPNSQRFFWPDGDLKIGSDQMRASLVLDENTVDRATLVSDVLNVSSTGSGAWAVARLQISTRQTAQYEYDIALNADGFVPPLPALGTLPSAFDTLSVRGKATFDRAFDIQTVAQDRPQPVNIRLDSANATWGSLGLKANGNIEIDDAGVPSGILNVQASNWREMLEIVRESDQVSPTFLTGLEQGLTLLSRFKGNASSLDIALEMKNGRVFAGPLPLGKAPLFRIP